MILKETLRKIVIDQKTDLEFFEYGTEREGLGSIPLELPHAVIVSGIRRSGKITRFKINKPGILKIKIVIIR